MVADTKIGVLALQGSYQKHQDLLQRMGIETAQVRNIADLRECEGLIIPGGESTVVSASLNVDNFFEKLAEYSLKHPIMGTCAGAILMARASNDSKIRNFGLIDVEIERNAYGSQQESFKENIIIEGFTHEKEYEAYFIRAPKIIYSAPSVEILATHDGNPVFVKQNNNLAMTFHPELTDDDCIHKYFISLIKNAG